MIAKKYEGEKRTNVNNREIKYKIFICYNIVNIKNYNFENF